MSSTPKQDQLTSRSKSLLGWSDNNELEYQKCRIHLKAYVIMKSLTGPHGASDVEWEPFRQYTMDPDNSLPASGGTMISLSQGDDDSDKVRKRFHHSLLGSPKKIGKH